jgi:hypothetical protein
VLPGLIVLPELLLPLMPPGVSAAPVAEFAPDVLKYEKTLWRQLGWLRSVLASKLGADCNLVASPVKTKLVCGEPAELGLLVLLKEEEVLAPNDAGRKSIQGTATCFPPPTELDELVPMPLVALLVEVAPEVLDGVVAEVPELAESEITAHSSRPEPGLIIVSLMVPISVPEGPLT